MNRCARTALMANISKLCTDQGYSAPTFKVDGKRISNKNLRIMGRNMGVSLRKKDADLLMRKD